MFNIGYLIVYYLFCFGFTAVLIYGKPFEPVRKAITIKIFKEMWDCPLCLGYWVSVFSYVLFYHSHFPIGAPIIDILFYSFSSAGVTWLLCAVTENALWNKAYVEVLYKRLDKVDKMGEKELYG